MHEVDVTLTDYALTLEALIFASVVARGRHPRADARRWFLVFWIATAAAAFFGGTLHGFLPEEGTWAHEIVWRLSLVSIGVTALSGWMLAARLLLPPRVARWIVVLAWLQFAALVGVLLFVGDDFRFAVADYVPPVVLLLWLLARRASRTRSRAAALAAAGFALTLVAAAIQRLGIALHPAWFDHNAFYHLVQAFALVAIHFGMRPLLDGPEAAAPPGR